MTDATVPIDLRRKGDAKLQVSRIAADLFWRDGVSATRGEDIAEAAGIAPRTLWRYFRSKESCVEPVLRLSARRYLAVIEAWPLEASIDDYLGGAAVAGPVVYSPDDIRAIHMVALGFDEPSLRSAWLMVCEEAERESWPIIARRLDLPAESADLRRTAAAVAGAIRALNDSLSVDFVATQREPDSAEILGALSTAFREASGGRLGAAAV